MSIPLKVSYMNAGNITDLKEIDFLFPMTRVDFSIMGLWKDCVERETRTVQTSVFEIFFLITCRYLLPAQEIRMLM